MSSAIGGSEQIASATLRRCWRKETGRAAKTLPSTVPADGKPHSRGLTLHACNQAFIADSVVPCVSLASERLSKPGNPMILSLSWGYSPPSTSSLMRFCFDWVPGPSQPGHHVFPLLYLQALSGPLQLIKLPKPCGTGILWHLMPVRVGVAPQDLRTDPLRSVDGAFNHRMDARKSEISSKIEFSSFAKTVGSDTI